MYIPVSLTDTYCLHNVELSASNSASALGNLNLLAENICDTECRAVDWCVRNNMQHIVLLFVIKYSFIIENVWYCYRDQRAMR